MKANELMVGNWVLWKNKKVQIARVSGIVYSFGHIDVTLAHCNDDNLLETHDIKSVSPIPLTSDVLEKNGFKKEGRWFIIEDDYYDVSIKEITDSIWRVKYCNTEFSAFDCVLHVAFVHQLQNALRLCGIEKEIEL